MGRSRKARRKAERARAKHRVERPGLSAGARIGIGLLGALGVAAGILLLASGTPATAARLGRIAGILILLGAIGVVVAAVGKI